MKAAQFFQYAHFWLGARSPLDIHSPFVYHFYSKVLKDKQNYPYYITFRERYPETRFPGYYFLLNRITHFFKPSGIAFHGNPGPERDSLFSGHPGTTEFTSVDNSKECNLDMVFLDLRVIHDLGVKAIDPFLQHIHKESVFILWNLRETPSTHLIWKEFQKLPGVTVSIDLFQTGLIFFNENLSREEFRLRF